MWWQRRPTCTDRRALVGVPPARGAWPTGAIAVGVPVVFVLGWALPLFGVPLAVFLIIGVVVGAWRRRRPEIPVSPASAGR